MSLEALEQQAEAFQAATKAFKVALDTLAGLPPELVQVILRDVKANIESRTSGRIRVLQQRPPFPSLATH
jgi:hypothetical protein